MGLAKTIGVLSGGLVVGAIGASVVVGGHYNNLFRQQYVVGVVDQSTNRRADSGRNWKRASPPDRAEAPAVCVGVGAGVGSSRGCTACFLERQGFLCDDGYSRSRRDSVDSR